MMEQPQEPAKSDCEPHAESPQDYRPLSEMRLRADPPRVTRLSPKVLVGIGIAVSAILAGVSVFALRSASPAPKPQHLATAGKATPEGLANLPRDYAGLSRSVPQLGPPLPGDLGRSFLNAGVSAPGIGAKPPTAEEGRIAQEQDSARTSRLFASANAPQAASVGVSSKAQPQSLSSVPAATNANAVSPQDHKLAFISGPADRQTQSPDRLQAPTSPYVLQAGSVIPAALITGLRSDLPGQVTAQVTQNVFDSPTGRILLIPQGSRLIGQYDAQITFGQSRALLVWTRLVLPNGSSLVLDREAATDSEGYSGLADGIDNHWGSLFEAALLSSVLSVGAEAGTSDSENNLAQAMREGASQSFNQVGEQVVGRSLNVQPTITIRPGFPVRVLVNHDLILEPYHA